MERTPQAANVELLNIKIMIEETKGYTLSVDTYKKAKALGMKDPRYYIYASLRGSGMPTRDCWAIAFQGEGFNWEKSFLEGEMNKLEAQESVQKRIAEVQGKKAKNENSEELTAEELAKASDEAVQEVIDRYKHAETILEMAEQIKKEGGKDER